MRDSWEDSSRVRRNKRLDFAVNAFDKACSFTHVTFDLGIEPEARRLSKKATEPQRGIERDGALAMHDFVHPAGRNPQGTCQRVLRQAHRLHVFLQKDFPRSDVVKIGFAHVVLMVIDDLDLVSVSVPPDEADAPLVVDADAVGACPLAFEGFEPVARWHPQVLKPFRLVDSDQFTQGDTLDFSRQFSRRDFQPNLLGLFRAKRLNHRMSL